jgi:microcystin-dependent protein
MKSVFKKSTLSLALAASVIASASWSSASYACSSEPIVSSVCIMAAAKTGNFDGNFTLASGTAMSVQQYTALYSLIGSTYGSTQQNVNFNLPNLSGRVVVGAGQYIENGVSTIYQAGQKGGAMTSKGSVTLTSANLPAHLHSLTSSASGVQVTTAVGSLAVNLAGLSLTAGNLAGTTTLAGAKINASDVASALTISASNNLNSALSASVTPGATLYLGSSPKIYNTASTPMVGLASGSITGSGTININLTSPAAVGISGNPALAAVAGQSSITGAPVVNIGGVTNIAGAATPAPAAVSVPTMMPYLVLNYYIAINGVYPMYE